MVDGRRLSSRSRQRRAAFSIHRSYAPTCPVSGSVPCKAWSTSPPTSPTVWRPSCRPSATSPAIALFLFAGWGFLQQARPDNPFRGRPSIPVFSLALCGVFASFDRILTMANVSAGSSLQVSLVAGLTSLHADGFRSGLLGNTPGDTVINVVQLFQSFFQTFRNSRLLRVRPGLRWSRAEAPWPERLRRAIRLRGHADQRADDLAMAGHDFPDVMIVEKGVHHSRVRLRRSASRERSLS